MRVLHCCIDLELEQPYTNLQTPDSMLNKEKIIQVGYVIYQLEPEFKVVKQFSQFVNIGVKLSSFIKNLTKISDENIASGVTLNEIYEQLVIDQKHYKFSRVLKQWGGGDMNALKKELPDVKWEFGYSGCNIKHLYQIYAEANGLNTSGGLSKCMGRCGVTWEGRGKHDALIDALNTAKFHSFLYNKIKE
jgi:inhibitor of KinA sporulation pathway (predicted exonuclease)